MKHVFKPEKTNHGYYFSDCSCGWTGGVYETRKFAKDAQVAHKNGEESTVGKVKTTFQVGGPIVGMERNQ
jgi:hypothetical protein